MRGQVVSGLDPLASFDLPPPFHSQIAWNLTASAGWKGKQTSLICSFSTYLNIFLTLLKEKRR